jgi:hypothetical protein
VNGNINTVVSTKMLRICDVFGIRKTRKRIYHSQQCFGLKNSLIIHEENTKKNHKRVVSVYVILAFGLSLYIRYNTAAHVVNSTYSLIKQVT